MLSDGPEKSQFTLKQTLYQTQCEGYDLHDSYYVVASKFTSSDPFPVDRNMLAIDSRSTTSGSFLITNAPKSIPSNPGLPRQEDLSEVPVFP